MRRPVIASLAALCLVHSLGWCQALSLDGEWSLCRTGHLLCPAFTEYLNLLIYFRNVEIAHIFHHTQNPFLHFLRHLYRFFNYHLNQVLRREDNNYPRDWK